MKLKQISIFLENKTGRLAAALDLLGKNDINLSAFSLADTTDFGVARMIVDDCDKAKEVFKDKYSEEEIKKWSYEFRL